MKEERFTELDKDDIKRIIPCRQYKWLDDMESEYSEYRFFLEKLKSIKDVKYIGTRDMVYVVSSDYKYKDIKFTLSKRDGRKPANMNVGFIKKAGLSINPAKKYLLSVKDEQIQ